MTWGGLSKQIFTRESVMFMLGTVAFVNEVARGTDRPNVVYASLALMGVAAYLRGVAAGQKSGNGAH